MHPDTEHRSCSFCGSLAADDFHCPDCGFEFSEGGEFSTFEEIDTALYPGPSYAHAMIGISSEMESRAFYQWRDEMSALLMDVTRAADSFARNVQYLAARTNVEYWRVH